MQFQAMHVPKVVYIVQWEYFVPSKQSNYCKLKCL